MKKLLLFIFIGVYSISFSQIVLTENFQGTVFPPTGWTTATNVPTRAWNFTTVAFSPTGQATFNITGGKSACIGWIAQDQNAHLTSPAFSLVGFETATLTLKTKMGYEFMVAPNPNGNLEVQVSSDGATWTTKWVEEDYGVFTDYQTLSLTIDLIDYINLPSIKIRFQYTGNDADSLSIDDVLVTGITLGINDVFSSTFSINPNPANDFVNISNSKNNKISEISTTDINGRQVKNLKFNNVTETKFNVSDLNSGVYFITINTDNGKAIKKFIKI